MHSAVDQFEPRLHGLLRFMIVLKRESEEPSCNSTAVLWRRRWMIWLADELDLRALTLLHRKVVGIVVA